MLNTLERQGIQDGSTTVQRTAPIPSEKPLPARGRQSIGPGFSLPEGNPFRGGHHPVPVKAGSYASRCQEEHMKKIPGKTITVAAILVLGIGSLQAQPRTEKTVSLAIANERAAAAVAECQAKGYADTATVVDRAGQVKAVHRADGASPHTIDASRRKAYTAASMRNNTTTIMEVLQKNPGARNLGQIDGILLLGGGMPVRVGNEVIGAIGVGGAPGGHLDDPSPESDPSTDLLAPRPWSP